MIALAYADITDNALSAVYCAYEPARADLSLGTFNVLSSIDFAHKNGLKYVYLGYCVLDCPSLVYKARFGAQERLVGRPKISDTPLWQQWQHSPSRSR
jgi:arginine-tRNA-protein transferase